MNNDLTIQNTTLRFAIAVVAFINCIACTVLTYAAHRPTLESLGHGVVGVMMFALLKMRNADTERTE